MADIAPGVRVVPTPGHTPGHQSVAVDTDDGVVMIAGDCANCMENVVDLVPVGIVHETFAELALAQAHPARPRLTSFPDTTRTSCREDAGHRIAGQVRACLMYRFLAEA